MKRRALISVSDKTGLVDFAKELVAVDYEIVSTGGTYKTLKNAGIPAIYVTEVTGFPEILDGRVKTLHPFIHAGILAMRTPEHLAQLEKLGITPIDLVICNLYPFKQTIAKEGVSLEEAIENIDIGGPSMVRAAAKNNQYVAIVVNPKHYDTILAKIKEGGIDDEMRLRLAMEAYAHTAEYDTYIATYLRKVLGDAEDYPENLNMVWEKAQDLRYGENPHQSAAFYRSPFEKGASVSSAQQLQGKELSFNNIIDINAALELVREFSEPAAVVIKHTNPCGTALGKDLYEAYTKAYAADPVSAYGGIVGCNKEVDAVTAKEMAGTFLECVIAPSFSKEALEILAAKKNLRLMETGDLTAVDCGKDMKRVNGGLLLQDFDRQAVTINDLQVVSKKQPTKEQLEELLFAWIVVKHVKSNAIVLSKEKQIIGVGAGQMNRVGSTNIALTQAGEKAQGAFLASDAYLPFRDTIDQAAKAGITAVIQPGGSIRDAESIAAVDEHDIVMVFTGVRHFKH